MTNSSREDLTGRVLGSYTLLRRLGRGGMANVYLAHQNTLDRPVALKILKPELAVDRAYVTRFHREARAAANLVQANIVQIHEVGEIDGLHFIAQEYVRGQNLRQYLSRHKVVEPILAISIMRQVALALARASEQGVIHRDIKPENIMLAPNGEVKVTDFGLARIGDGKSVDLTQIGIAMGTPLYMSPEQAEGRAVDTRSDLYSLGITAWHMLAGRPPFEGETALSIVVQHVRKELPSLKRIRPDLPDELCNLVHQLAAKSPDDRIQTPAQLVRELRKLDFDDFADWDQLSERLAATGGLADAGAPTVEQSRFEVTRQLESLMRGHFVPWWRSKAMIGTLLVTAILGIAGGIAAGMIWPPEDPFARASAREPGVERQATAKDQYYAALWVTDPVEAEQALKAVAEYFSPFDQTGAVDAEHLFYARKADVRLGSLYLQTGQYEKADEAFRKLASLESTERELRLIGLAGLALVYDHTKERDKVEPLLPEIAQGIDDIRGYLGDEIRALLDRYRNDGSTPVQSH